jgi:DNA polymerase-3 subunit alpha
MAASEFIHLHNHSDYSLLDGAQNVQVLTDTISDLKMDAVGLTEHGNLFSVVPFYKAAKKAGVKPIIGCEIYVAQGSRFDRKTRSTGGWGNNHLVLLVQNYTGYRNLMKLVTYGYLEGFYYRPRVDKELLKKYNEGLICLSACLKGEVPERLLKNDWEGAKKAALEFAEIFPDRYYLEIQNHLLDEEQFNIQKMKKLSAELELPLVVTNDAHYARSSHAKAHDIHICLGTGKDLRDPNRLRYATSEFYIKSQDEMWKLFSEFPQAMENTRKIADSVDVKLSLGEYHLPNFPIPKEAKTDEPDDYLKELAKEELKKRYPKITAELSQRLDHELAVIKKMGFAGYFLITADFVKYAKERHVPVGPGRGSAAGSLVSYALGITNIDPMKHNLLFERFLNPERVSLPDIDIDFCIERRGEVINYIKEKYGDESVTQIITFGKMKARQVVRDVGRVMGYSFAEIDKVAKAIPLELNITLDDALSKSPDLRNMANGPYKELMDHSVILEGMNRHASIHAAGVVIAPGDLTDYVPLYKSSQDDITSQYDMKGLEDLGLLKMDFLGLRNLTVIDNTVRMVNKKGVDLDIEKIPMDDPKVFHLFSKGWTIGVFQFESSGMREYLKKLKPTVFEDLIAMNALYRPGPMENISSFISRKHGRKKINYIHPELESILKETYGIIVYQEQVMQIANQIAGFTLAEADVMRRAMGKKIKSLMTDISEKFIEGAVKRKIPRGKAKEIFALIEKFAQYGFNKSHSTAYAYIAYQTAWLKTYYPAEFMAANLTSEMSNIDRVVILINECRKMKIKVAPPDIRISKINFYPVDDNTISFGLNAIKNVGVKALVKIIKAREKDEPFKDIFDVCSRVDLRVLNKKVLESLVMSGAFDALKGSRAQNLMAVEKAIKYGQQRQNGENHDQFSLFHSRNAGESDMVKVPDLPVTAEWTAQEALKREKDVLGLYISGHPLLKYAEILEEYSNYDFSETVGMVTGGKIQIGGSISELRLHYDRKNNQMAFFNLECLGGQAEIVAFSDTYSRYRDIIEDDAIIFVKGKPTDESDFSDLKIIAEQVIPLDDREQYLSKRVNIRLTSEVVNDIDLDELYRVAKKYQGEYSMVFHLVNGPKKQRILAHNIKVSSHRDFLKKLKDVYGKQNIWVE